MFNLFFLVYLYSCKKFKLLRLKSSWSELGFVYFALPCAFPAFFSCQCQRLCAFVGENGISLQKKDKRWPAFVWSFIEERNSDKNKRAFILLWELVRQETGHSVIQCRLLVRGTARITLHMHYFGFTRFIAQATIHMQFVWFLVFIKRWCRDFCYHFILC